MGQPGTRGRIAPVTRRQFVLLILPLLLVLAGFVALHVAERFGGMGAPAWDADFSDFVRRRMEREFVFGLGDEERQEEVYFEALTRYLRIYDRYGEVVAPRSVTQAREESSGQYYGIGIRQEPQPEVDLEAMTETPIESMKITGVKPGGPADKAGLTIGEHVVSVDGRPLADFGADRRFVIGAIAAAIKGERHTTVRLGVRDLKHVEREVEVTRDAVSQGSVFGVRFLDREQGLAYVRISNFHNDTARTVRGKIDELLKNGLKGLVLDLRGNPGGLFEQAVNLADLFVDDQGPLGSNVIVRQVGRLPEYSRAAFATRKATIARNLPLVVLIDRGSASASEIFAGALQDHRRAVIVGERSYGKFLIQTVTQHKTRFGPALLKRTCAIYETPAGHFYPRRSDESWPVVDPLGGIPPDVLIPIENGDAKKIKAIFLRESLLDWNPDIEPVHADFADPHVDAALQVLRGEPVISPIPQRAHPG